MDYNGKVCELCGEEIKKGHIITVYDNGQNRKYAHRACHEKAETARKARLAEEKEKIKRAEETVDLRSAE